ncbi:MAG: fused MFS/spermidine synthase [Proteobacteria bacterium]|nr:fused MFS/spermidine synthase [Pseudomonadota bacterium]
MPVSKVAFLLFSSGACALIYQVAWLRELRLVFGASTAASAAVLAIFMGGLGLGGLFLGRRADRHGKPLLLYANLEVGVSILAAFTPLFLWGVRLAYIGLGGQASLGHGGATLVRLLLSALVLAVPTILMGGTLPAAGRAVETPTDPGRRRIAVLYGVNTLGAVLGALAATFFMLEILGTRRTIWFACLLNGLVALFARSLATAPAKPAPEVPEVPEKPVLPQAAARADAMPASSLVVLVCAGVVGFAFFLMELVWYRMLSPVLGGSTYTFGLILAVALAGIGVGGALYAFRQRGTTPTLAGFALTLSLEALFLAVPFALGDRLAVLAGLLAPLGVLGLSGRVMAWGFITCLTVFPAALAAGYQFPLLIGLLGRGEKDAGRHTGHAYAANTLGAIAGSLAGGFGVLPLLSAPGAWRAVVVLLSALAGAVLAEAVRSGRRSPAALAAPLVAGVLALALLFTTGPTAAWRHSSIGAGRADLTSLDRNGLQEWMSDQRRSLFWEKDGMESSVGILASDSFSFVVNGKSDGNARWDASTQVMLGLVGALLRPEPKSAMVIGLGTGESAGWLAALPGMERVDVAEIEPAILHMAELSAPVNQDVLSAKNVNVILGDGREFMLTTKERYDIIASEPSNPYRAGIASLYTLEYYRAAARCLNPGGVFCQWVQAYEVDFLTIETIYATLRAVFPNIHTFQTMSDDLLLVASREPLPLSGPALLERMAQEPFASALADTWGATSLEGFLAHYVCRPELAERIARRSATEGWLNTDDRMLIEFGFARTVGRKKTFDLADLIAAARTLDLARPEVPDAEVDWDRVDAARLSLYALQGTEVADKMPVPTEPLAYLKAALDFWVDGNLKGVMEAWLALDREPENLAETAMFGEALADTGNPAALDLALRLDAHWPMDAEVIRARCLLRQKDTAGAVEALTRAYTRLRTDPWCQRLVMLRGMELADEIAGQDANLAAGLFDLFAQPFSTNLFQHQRQKLLFYLGQKSGLERLLAAVRALEPNPLWERPFLRVRMNTYLQARDPMAEQARRDFVEFLVNQQSGLDPERFRE